MRAAKTPQTREMFAMIPREFAVKPGAYRLTTLETALLAGILRAVLGKDYKQRDKIAFRAGKRALVEHRQKGGKYDARGKDVARSARRQSMLLQKKKSLPAEIIVIKLTSTELLKWSGVSPDTRHQRKLDAGLKKLTKLSLPKKPALLRSYRRFLDGTIKLFVSGAWLDPPYVKVPLPLPTRSKNAINLGLFLRCIADRGYIRLSTLAHDVLGLPTTKACEQRRFIERALVVLNAALYAIYTKMTAPDGKYSFRRNDVPILYVMKIERDLVRFGQGRKPCRWALESGAT